MESVLPSTDWEEVGSTIPSLLMRIEPVALRRRRRPVFPCKLQKPPYAEIFAVSVMAEKTDRNQPLTHSVTEY